MSQPDSANHISSNNHTISKLDHHLFAYAAAASAAGVGLLALAQPAYSEVIYTPAQLSLPENSTLSIDIDGDGTADFKFINQHHSSGVQSYFETYGHVLVDTGPAGNQVIASGRFAAALPSSSEVGSGAHFLNGNRHFMVECLQSYNFQRIRGPWRHVQNRYLGLQFAINGETHFGWIRITSSHRNSCKFRLVVTGYAYETEPNKPIVTGQTSKANNTGSLEPEQPAWEGSAAQHATLGLLAQGAPGVEAWRRAESATEDH